MTKTFTLLLSPNCQCYYDKQFKDAKFKPPAMCRAFVEWATHTGTLAREINVTASTDEIPGATKIFVTKQGYYRWNWSDSLYPNRRNPLSHHMDGGISTYSEDTLNRFFPDAREDGLDQPRPLWLSFTLPK